MLLRRSVRDRQDGEPGQYTNRLCRRFEKVIEKRRRVRGLHSKPAHANRASCLPIAKDSPEELPAFIRMSVKPSVPVSDIPRRETAHGASHLARPQVSKDSP